MRVCIRRSEWEDTQDSDEAINGEWCRYVDNDEGPRNKSVGEWDEDAAMDVWCHEKYIIIEHVRGSVKKMVPVPK